MAELSKTALSTAWRQGRSTEQVYELAGGLRSLRKVIGALNPEEMLVTFNSTADSWNSRQLGRIVIDPTYAMKSVPILDTDFDILTGLAVHEAMHSIVDTHDMRLDNEGLAGDRITPETVAVIGEEIYCDGYAERHYVVPAQYVDKARKAYKVEKLPEDSWHKLLHAWMNISLYGFGLPPDLPMATAKALAIIMPHSANLRRKDFSTQERMNVYANLAKELNRLRLQEQSEAEQTKEKLKAGGTDSEEEEWADKVADKAIESRIEDETDAKTAGDDGESDGEDEKDGQDGKNPDSSDSGDNDSESESEHKDGETDGDNGSSATGDVFGDIQTDKLIDGEGILPMHLGGAVSKQLLDQVVEAMEQQTVDITADLEAAVEEDRKQRKDSMGEIPPLGRVTIPTTIFRDADKLLPNVEDFDKKLYEQMGWLKRIKNHAGRVINRFEDRGRVDRGTLYRAPIDGRVFRTTKRLPEQELDFVILLDASGSMSGRTAVYEAAYAIHRQLPKVQIYSYDSGGRGGIVTIVRHTIDGEIKQVRPGGGTPTGIAMLTILEKHPDSLIFVFTDGESNTGFSPDQVFSIMPHRYPNAKILYVQYHSGRHIDNTGKRYGDSAEVVTVQNIEEVADMMRDALMPWFNLAA